MPQYFFRKMILLVMVFSIPLTGCSSPTSVLMPTPSMIPTETMSPTKGSEVASIIPTQKPTPSVEPKVFYGFTYHRPDGNRLVSGRGDLPGIQPMDIPLAGEPAWVVSAPSRDRSIWVVALGDGRLQAFQVFDGAYEVLEIEPENLPPGKPPLLKVVDGIPSVVQIPGVDASPYSHAVPLRTDSEQVAFIDENGDVVISKGIEEEHLVVNALPDARLLLDETGRLLLLTNPTGRYDHGVLGDAIEAESITLIDTNPEPHVSLKIDILPPAVIEGVVPIWADITGDGQREIIVTLTSPGVGAQIAVLNENGERIASGPPIGQGYRWRNQLAVAPTAPDAGLEFVDVLTPHIGGVVEFYQLSGSELQVLAQFPGYTSHVIGSRNLDMALAGDFDGDQKVEVLLPDQSRTELGAVRRTADGAELAWTLPVGGMVSTNLAAVSFPDGRMAVGVGRNDGVLRVWVP